jgi:hypothetical protein
MMELGYHNYNRGLTSLVTVDKVIVWSALRASREYLWLQMPVRDNNFCFVQM